MKKIRSAKPISSGLFIWAEADLGIGLPRAKSRPSNNIANNVKRMMEVEERGVVVEDANDGKLWREQYIIERRIGGGGT